MMEIGITGVWTWPPGNGKTGRIAPGPGWTAAEAGAPSVDFQEYLFLAFL